MLNEIKVDEGKGRSRKGNDQYKKSEGPRNSRTNNNNRDSDNVVRATTSPRQVFAAGGALCQVLCQPSGYTDTRKRFHAQSLVSSSFYKQGCRPAGSKQLALLTSLPNGGMWTRVQAVMAQGLAAWGPPAQAPPPDSPCQECGPTHWHHAAS